MFLPRSFYLLWSLNSLSGHFTYLQSDSLKGDIGVGVSSVSQFICCCVQELEKELLYLFIHQDDMTICSCVNKQKQAEFIVLAFDKTKYEARHWIEFPHWLWVYLSVGCGLLD